MKEYLRISEEVQTALAEGKPVVALETTLIAFGLPHPHNLQTAIDMQNIIRREGAVPATIGLLDGMIQVGLTEEQIERFATGSSASKTSRRDIPYLLANRTMGATTISGTMIAAQLAGIPVFATGGLGGVHREGEISWDVSADLIEMSRTKVAVVSSGAKAILDLTRTLEYLETFGVPVIGYQSEYFASFYSRQSGLLADIRLDTPNEIAAVMDAKWRLGLSGGILVANPVPAENEIPFGEINVYIEQAVGEAARDGIAGKDVTPYLLRRINELTEGRSLSTNLALVRNNARVGAQIAVAYAKLQEKLALSSRSTAS
ncbi:pseudouridine-5'-phosphate glycosidase [Paenibacillaceae bacterium WGS1546]|uniref:pseudouridine-5'-phosphate glycosidase n=1 Tax=Cohnella sp. WGS1546 TaxID=3366810 RepID=UPI00372CF3AD